MYPNTPAASTPTNCIGTASAYTPAKSNVVSVVLHAVLRDRRSVVLPAVIAQEFHTGVPWDASGYAECSGRDASKCRAIHGWRPGQQNTAAYQKTHARPRIS